MGVNNGFRRENSCVVQPETEWDGRSFGPRWGNALRSFAMRSLPLRFRWLPLVAAACTLSACGGSHDDLTKRLASVQADLTRLQNHSDRLEERLEALEMKKEAPSVKAAAAEPAGNVVRPRLMIVKLEPGEVAPEAATDAPTAALRPEDSAADQTPRPMIRVYGSKTDVDPGSDSPRRKR